MYLPFRLPVSFSRRKDHGLLLRMLFGTSLLFVFMSLCAQSKSARDSDPLRKVYYQYINELGATARYINGAEYDGAYPLVSGTAFWNEEGFQMGKLGYEGVLYHEVPLALDLVQGAVLTRGPQNQRWRLEKTKVDSFILAGHTFVFLATDTNSRNTLPEDFYDRLFDGEVKVFAKRSKFVTRGLNAASRDSFSTRTTYFIRRSQTYFPVSREKDLLAIFRNERGALSAFWKANGFHFKNDPELFILKTVAFWSQLKK